VRGDANASGVVDVSDGLRILFYLFDGAPVSCVDALDANDSGAVDLSDALRVLAYIFQGGPQPSAPFPSSGSDPSRDDPLDCAVGTP
jgi:hypothetical protein